jgi:hypothetical protein
MLIANTKSRRTTRTTRASKPRVGSRVRDSKYAHQELPVLSYAKNPRALHIATFFPNRIAAVTKPGTKLIRATLWMPPNIKAMTAPQHHRAIMKIQVAVRTCPRQRRPSDSSKTTPTLLLSTALGSFGNRGTRPYHSPTRLPGGSISCARLPFPRSTFSKYQYI